ncbi:MAG: AAC(3) family N-acetyltransferase, partial [Cyanobacteria bacterium P01_E01_bin.42]
FQEVLQEEGTLAVYTAFGDYGRYGTPFILEESPSRLGAFSEYIRNHPNSIRSLHPIASITALGKRAQEIIGKYHYDGFGYDSPWGKLHRINAKIMTLGLSNYANTGLSFIHYIEQLYGVPYTYKKIFTTPIYAKGKRVSGLFTMSVRYLKNYRIEYSGNLHFRDYLVEVGAAKQIPLGRDGLFLSSCNLMIDKAIECLRKNRYYFLKHPPQFKQGEIPMDGITGPPSDSYESGDLRLEQ